MLPLKRLFKTRDGQIFENSIKAFKFFVASETPKKLAKFPENIYQIKQDIAQKKYQKLVLAHREVIKNHKFETELFWEAALIDSKNQYVFIYQIDSESVFFGVSPERLFKRIKIKNKNYIYTEALAGTKLSGEFENKEKQEQSFVEKFIEESLEKLCVGFEKLNSKKIIYSGNLKHLKSEYKGELREGVLDSDILNMLHPTPALSGYPVKESLARIRELEDFDRGYYGAPIGVSMPDYAEYAVGIRSGLISKNNLYLYAGAGITAESDPGSEWQEILNKLGVLKGYLKSCL